MLTKAKIRAAPEIIQLCNETPGEGELEHLSSQLNIEDFRIPNPNSELVGDASRLW